MRIIGHGIDLADTARIRRLLDEHGGRFLDRCFTPAEQAYCNGRKLAHDHFAARFAAKEAVLKALGTGLTGGIEWTDVEITRDDLGPPRVALSGRAAEVAASMGVTSWSISLTHTAGMAAASALAIGESLTAS